jgi:two-component system, NtrC family, sensor kinase
MISVFRSASLIVKVLLVTTVVLIIAISINAWWEIRLLKKNIESLTYQKTEIISEFIEKNVIRTMERGKHFEIHAILKNFIYGGIWRINVFTPDGIIRASTSDAELNKSVGDLDLFTKNEFFIREENIQTTDGKEERVRIYYHNRPILNHPECRLCHRGKGETIGVLTVANSLKDMDEQIFRQKRDAVVIAILTIAALFFVLGLLFLKFVNTPLSKLTDVMKKVEQGDLNARVALQGKDEMGRLAQNLNAMIEKLNAAKKEAEEYHQALVQRADRMASIGELASGIAHEIRNPLAGIQGAIQILAEGFSKEDARRQVTDEIQKQIYKMERLVRDLLNYAKPVPSNYVLTDIHEVINRVLSFFMTQRGRPENLRVEKHYFSPMPKTMIDPSSMEQAFLNIVINAQKAMPRGGTFTISTAHLNGEVPEAGKVQVIFEDTGMGILDQNLPKIFNPFFSTRSDGTGLGLSITKNIIEEHGGTIEVESLVNVGTQFIITLPVTREQHGAESIGYRA